MYTYKLHKLETYYESFFIINENTYHSWNISKIGTSKELFYNGRIYWV